MATDSLVNPFTDSFIQEMWDSKAPLQLLGEAVVQAFHSAGDSYAEADLEQVQILAEFFLHSVSFVKLDLRGSNSQAEKWVELLLYILRRNIEEQSFEAEADFQLFRELLLKLCSGLSPVFNKQQMQTLMDHFTTTYVKQIGLYRLTFTRIRPSADIKQTLFIDKPMPFPSLKDSKMIIKEEAKAEQTQELRTEEVADRVKIPLEERLQALKYPEVDEDSQKIVAAKVAAARNALQAKMQERQKRLETRITEAEKDLKRRRK
jgi:hypothetical protein